MHFHRRLRCLEERLTGVPRLFTHAQELGAKPHETNLSRFCDKLHQLFIRADTKHRKVCVAYHLLWIQDRNI